MYSIGNFLQKTPVQISGAVVTVLNVLVLTGVLTWDDKTVAGVNIALIAVLGLFVTSTTTNTAKLQEFQDHTLEAIQVGRDLEQEKVSQATTKKVAKAVTKKNA